MRQSFSEIRFTPARLEKLNIINDILEEYKADGYVLTLRQLYYQLVSRDIIANKLTEYKNLSSLLTDGRMAGIVDWSAIEDRGRQPKIPYWVSGVSGALQDTLDQYRLDRQEEQPKYIEIWVEKDALSNIFYRVTSKYHVRLMVNKGYSSSSAMYDAANRFKEHSGEKVLLYFGDHDPSGKDMVRDIRDRFNTFRVEDIEVFNPALNFDQIKKYSPPENPTKVDDPRAKEYIAKYGHSCWELDALPPKVLAEIIEQSLLPHVNIALYNDQLDQERRDKKTISKFIDDYEASK